MKTLFILAIAIALPAIAWPQTPDFSVYDRQYPWVIPPKTIEERMKKQPGFNYDEALVKAPMPRHILTLDGGDRITKETWISTHRPKILEQFRREMFGISPPKPSDLTFRIVETDAKALDGKATRKKVAISFKIGDDPFTFHLTLYTPNASPKPAPAFLLLDHRSTGAEQPDRDYWPVAYGISRGYAMAIIPTAAEVDPDKANATTGIRQRYGDKYSWGTLAAWAWAGSRGLDYLVTDPAIDGKRVAVIGHSRSGKAALWAGATDERFALVCPNGSGQGGTKLSKRHFGETLARINTSFPHWFTANYKAYNQRESDLPFDQHQLIACIAPRGYHDGQGSEDLWADPRGSWLSSVEASPVWKLYGQGEVLSPEQPLVNKLVVNGPMAWHMHAGGHALGVIDWKWYMDHADGLK